MKWIIANTSLCLAIGYISIAPWPLQFHITAQDILDDYFMPAVWGGHLMKQTFGSGFKRKK